MRLSPDQCQLILATVRQHVAGQARVLLFGSRLDDHARGGDVDLLIESETALPLMQRATIKNELEQRLALPVDVIALQSGHAATPFQAIALAQAVLLEDALHDA